MAKRYFANYGKSKHELMNQLFDICSRPIENHKKKHVKYGEIRYGLPLGKQQIRLDY
jgi:hypothetical protein